MNLLLAIAVLSPVIGATLVLAVNERLSRVVVSTSLGTMSDAPGSRRTSS